MTALTDEMIASIKAVPVFPLATASKDGIPNVAPMGMVFVADPETIWIADNFMNKTRANVEENPKASLYVYGAGAKGCLQIKADVTVATEGEDFEKLVSLAFEKKPTLNPKAVLILKITDLFTCAPGPDAGAKLA